MSEPECPHCHQPFDAQQRAAVWELTALALLSMSRLDDATRTRVRRRIRRLVLGKDDL